MSPETTNARILSADTLIKLSNELIELQKTVNDLFEQRQIVQRKMDTASTREKTIRQYFCQHTLAMGSPALVMAGDVACLIPQGKTGYGLDQEVWPTFMTPVVAPSL